MGRAAKHDLSVKRPKIEEGIYEADFPLKWMHKDLHLMALTAYECGVPIPSGNLLKEIFCQANQAELGDKDFSVIFERITSGK